MAPACDMWSPSVAAWRSLDSFEGWVTRQMVGLRLKRAV